MRCASNHHLFLPISISWNGNFIRNINLTRNIYHCPFHNGTNNDLSFTAYIIIRLLYIQKKIIKDNTIYIYKEQETVLYTEFLVIFRFNISVVHFSSVYSRSRIERKDLNESFNSLQRRMPCDESSLTIIKNFTYILRSTFMFMIFPSSLNRFIRLSFKTICKQIVLIVAWYSIQLHFIYILRNYEFLGRNAYWLIFNFQS